MLWAFRTKAIQMSATLPSVAIGKATRLPASDFDVSSGNRFPTIFFPIFSGFKPCFKLFCSCLMKLPPARN
jgi:hypothetical protein